MTMRPWHEALKDYLKNTKSKCQNPNVK